MRKLHTVWIAALTLLPASTTVLGQTIRLKAQANADFHQDVRLGDIATISASQPRQAEALANTVVVAGIDKSLTLKSEAVLMALISQRTIGEAGGAIGNNLQISGAASCRIAVLSAQPASIPLDANAPAVISPVLQAGTRASVTAAPPSATPGPAVPVAPPPPAQPGTLRETIIDRLTQDSGAARADLQVEFNSTSPLVDQPTIAGQRWLVRPLTRTLLGSVQFEAQLAEGIKVLQRLNVATEVRRRQRVLVTTAKISRGDILTSDKFQYQDAWMDRKVPTLFATDKEVIGLEAQRDVDVGCQIDQRDFKPLLMAHRDDVITVIYIAGPLEVQLRGRALADAKFHEQVQVRNESTNESYTATMLKKNLGVVGNLSAEEEKALLETQE